jgi:iron complex outermembrane receptor protein
MINERISPIVAVCVVLAAMSGASLPSLVATAAEIEEIVVTARKREESLQETPVSVTAFSGEELQSRGLTDLAELGQFTPNMTFDFSDANSGNSNSAIIHIRGIGASDWTLTVDPGVGLYVDGVYVSRSVGGVLDLLDFERVEVLRGPQGTLFGKNTIGGAISITTRKPSLDALAGSLEVTAGNYDRIDVRGDINLPITESLAGSAAFSVKKRDGYVENLAPGGVDLGEEDSMSGRLALRWQPVDLLLLDFSADYTREREGPAANVTLAINDYPPTLAWLYNAFFSGDPSCGDVSDPARFSNPLCYNSQWIPDDPYETYKVSIDIPEVTEPLGEPIKPESNIDLWGLALTGEWQVTDALTAKLISAYRKAENGYWSRTLAVPDIPFAQTITTWEQDQVSNEIQLIGSTLDKRLEWILGLYALDEEGCNLDVAVITGTVLYTDNCVDNASRAVFGQMTYSLTSRLDLTLGARYTDEDKRFTPDSYVYADLGLGIPAGTRLIPNEEARTQATETTPYVNLAYRWNDDLMTYASYSEGFKSGGFTQRVFPPRDTIPSFEPEFAEVYEIGFKSTAFDQRVRLNGALFYTDYTDMQINVAASSVGSGEVGDVGVITANAGAAEIYGGELELLALAGDHWRVEASVGYLNASYDEISPGAILIDAENELVNAPEWSTMLGITYTYPLSSGVLEPRVYYAYTSKVYNTPENDVELVQPGLGLLSAILTWRDGRDAWSVTLEGHNLTDEAYIVDGVNDAGNGFIDGTYGMPRTWSVSLRRRF